ncbi:Holliday junction branch migration protein RuvA [Paraneptunicella aestuarii]|uniref:Holliday junction branch migration protein RuvA n=1 Tax=Paraneptunicella aestuarii TaxID=2831148 RepID=UPI001E54C9A1|nr:Holliday junction branch migration protein RuvA [Paraneptunicella aestuarii]UAA37332.1 Holliday junction branch migration protein RuvA [Paraneptunicella aestuarii]
MIGRIRGILVEKTPPFVLVDVMGVGYEIQMPMTSLYQLPETGCEVNIYTHFVVREDAQLLFGFANKDERALFREVIKANGVGPKLALTILSGMSAQQFIVAVNEGDVTALVKLPGVGKKTAERLLVEMKDRLGNLEFGQAMSFSVPVAGATHVIVEPPSASAKSDAISALIALGYTQAQADKMVKGVYREELSSEELIREALRSIA